MKKTCEFCGGTGQTNFFKGVSRFLLSSEECPECCGLGFHIGEDSEEEKKTSIRKKTVWKKAAGSGRKTTRNKTLETK